MFFLLALLLLPKIVPRMSEKSERSRIRKITIKFIAVDLCVSAFKAGVKLMQMMKAKT